MKLSFKLLICLLTVYGNSVTAQKFTISGYVRDKKSGEQLKGASVFIVNKSTGTTSNNFGFYSVTLPKDSVILLVSFAGYIPFQSSFLLVSDQLLNVELQPANTMQEVLVKSVKKTAIQNRTQMSSIDLPVETIKSLPKFLGETDILKAIQLLPGVQAGGEGQSGLYVRGGDADQNLILLDGVPVYNASHLFGFFSVFNADAVKSVELIKGGFPARYGGRLSSVLDIQMKEGNKNEMHGEGGIGIIASRLTLEGPFKKGKESSFMISGRRTYIDILTKPLIKSQTDGVNAGYFFYDLNAKANIKISGKDHLYISGYSGTDKFYGNEKDVDISLLNSIKWGNVTGVTRWNHLFTNKIFGNLTAHISNYQFKVNSEEKSRTNANEFFKLQYYSGIRDYSVHYDLDILPNPNHFIKVGSGIVFHSYKPGAIQTKESSPGTPIIDTAIKSRFVNARETDTYAEDDIRWSGKLKTNLGVHFSTFSVDGHTFTSLQPRISARYLINNDLSAKISYAQMNQ